MHAHTHTGLTSSGEPEATIAIIISHADRLCMSGLVQACLDWFVVDEGIHITCRSVCPVLAVTGRLDSVGGDVGFSKVILAGTAWVSQHLTEVLSQNSRDVFVGLIPETVFSIVRDPDVMHMCAQEDGILLDLYAVVQVWAETV